MKAVKTIQRYQCDFCKKRSVKHVIELHEKRCYMNPNRFCDKCNNTGKYMQEMDTPYGTIADIETACPYCTKFNKQQKLDIEEYRRKLKGVNL